MKTISRNDYFKKIADTGQISSVGEYEIAPLDLSSYKLYEKTKKIVDANFMEETTDSSGNYMLRGHWLSDCCSVFSKMCDLTLIQLDRYSAFAYSDKQLALFTYCEGDITFTPFCDMDCYNHKKSELVRYYGNY